MHIFDLIQSFVLLALIVLATPLLGQYMANVFEGKSTFLHPLLGWFERLCYRISGIDPDEETPWTSYAKDFLIFNGIGFVILLLMLTFQNIFPLNPQNLPGVSWPLAFNISSSFVTNTNWQSYAGETTLSYFSQMLGLTVQNYFSAASGMAVFLALARGIAKKSASTLGNFWVDLVRMTLYVLLPLSFLFAVVLASQGVIQSLDPYVTFNTLEGGKQTIPLGLVASQEAIKQLGTNGGGFFNANSAHPFENPSGWTNFLEAFAILLIPAASTYTYGIIIGSKKHGWLLFNTMLTILVLGTAASLVSERLHDPVLGAYPLLEGIESRIGQSNSLFWTISTTATANGSTNAAISSLSPLSSGIAMFNIMLGELVFGGIGVGMCSILVFTLLTVFLSGLMVGRTPEYLGKKIEKHEMKWVMASVLIPGALILIGTSISVILPSALSSLGNHGPHGFSEILYAFTSSSGNNGSAFAGLNANTDYYNLVLGIVMIAARLAIVIPSLAIAGLLVSKKITPSSTGTLSNESFLFGVLLFSVIIIVGGLTFFPALSLGPVIEHLLMINGRIY